MAIGLGLQSAPDMQPLYGGRRSFHQIKNGFDG